MPDDVDGAQAATDGWLAIVEYDALARSWGWRTGFRRGLGDAYLCDALCGEVGPLDGVDGVVNRSVLSTDLQGCQNQRTSMGNVECDAVIENCDSYATV